ncbi:PKD domain-containing protein [Maribellus comscasis]|uniref:PKD domain-containing protein n=1 Tax=Maribellus comscasis TaxID=2681766 RepID=A0A6I6K3R1_9BACT|nr:LamG-like jellyroll fold domain-containing protein [Maribellus comscasis]QGY47217.1 PKD domain-containing protein [Maribellus comscasis]
MVKRIKVILYFIIISIIECFPADLSFNETFSDTNLESRGWEWIRESGTDWKIVNGQLDWAFCRKTIWREYNGNIPLLLRSAPSLGLNPSTEVTVNMANYNNSGAQVGLIWYYSDDDYVKLVVENLRQGLSIGFLQEHNISGHTIHILLPEEYTKHDLKIAVEGKNLVAFYRRNGSLIWNYAGEYPLMVRSDLPLKVGLMTQLGPNETRVQADDFKIITNVPDGPIALFDAHKVDKRNCRNGVAPMTVALDGSMSYGFNLHYLWKFGDGVSSSTSKVNHTFTKPGTYKVSLTVTDSCNKTDKLTTQFHVVNEILNDEDLILDLPFNEPDGITAYDYSRYDNVAYLELGAKRVEGKHGKAVRLYGGNDVVIVRSDSSLNGAFNELSMSVWIKLFNAQEGARILCKTNYDHNNPWELYIRNGKLVFKCKGELSSFDDIPLNEWVHLAAVYDGSKSTIYFNGVLQGTLPGAGDISNNTRYFQIGYADTHEGLIGLIDNVKVYKRALSIDEINKLF